MTDKKYLSLEHLIRKVVSESPAINTDKYQKTPSSFLTRTFDSKKNSSKVAGQSDASNQAASINNEEIVIEDVEPIDELSKKTLGSYVKKASHDVAKKAYFSGYDRGKDKPTVALSNKEHKRSESIRTAVDKLTKEEVEQEESKGTIERRKVSFVGRPKERDKLGKQAAIKTRIIDEAKLTSTVKKIMDEKKASNKKNKNGKDVFGNPKTEVDFKPNLSKEQDDGGTSHY